MQREAIEELILREFRGLCSSCLHVDTCVYHGSEPGRSVIQCELFELNDEPSLEVDSAQGLCKGCDFAPACKLPGRRTGTWHCNEFR